MKINKIEKAVLRQHFKNIGITFEDEEKALEDLRVEDRWLSGAGFITELVEDANLKIGKCSESQIGGEVGAILNSTIDSGYLFYIKNGYLKSIEGYTFGDPWPDEILKVATYKSELG